MITFNEISISEDGKSLVIKASKDNKSYFKNVSIYQIVINTQNNFNPYSPVTTGDNVAMFYWEGTLVGGNIKPAIPSDETIDSIDLKISSDELKTFNIDLSKDLLNVWIVCTGTIGEDAPCSDNRLNAIALAYNKNTLYSYGLSKISAIGKACTINMSFIDYILLEKAFKLAIETSNISLANLYWKELIGQQLKYISNGCGCNK